MSVDFNTLLSKPIDDFKPPVPLPAGTYYGVITGRKIDVTKNEKETPFVRFTVKLTHADPEVELDGIDLSKKSMNKDYYLSEAAGYRFKQLVESFGVSTAGKSLNEMIEEVLNQEVMLSITQRLNPKDPTAPPFNDINEMTAAVA